MSTLPFNNFGSGSSSYFDKVTVIQGDNDGSNDCGDWTVFHFDTSNTASYDHAETNRAFFGGETDHSGGDGGLSVTKGYIYGLNGSGEWILLYKLPLGSSSSNCCTHGNGDWFASGGDVTTGDGKRSVYDTVAISKIAFAVL